MEYSGAFFDTLGQYVYQYKNQDGIVYYTGKGNGNRCLSHVADKGFDHEECYIVARNLERFEDKKDWQSFLLESFLIWQDQPESNSVSGHYKDCFIMAKLSEMFDVYQSEQYDNFANLPEWYVENYDIFRGKLREVKVNSSTTFILSNARSAMYMMFYAPAGTSTAPIKVTFEVNQSGDRLEETKNQLKDWLKKNGYPKTSKDGKESKLAIQVDNIDAAISLFDEFMN